MNFEIVYLSNEQAKATYIDFDRDDAVLLMCGKCGQQIQRIFGAEALVDLMKIINEHENKAHGGCHFEEIESVSCPICRD